MVREAFFLLETIHGVETIRVVETIRESSLHKPGGTMEEKKGFFEQLTELLAKMKGGLQFGFDAESEKIINRLTNPAAKELQDDNNTDNHGDSGG